MKSVSYIAQTKLSIILIMLSAVFSVGQNAEAQTEQSKKAVSASEKTGLSTPVMIGIAAAAAVAIGAGIYYVRKS